MEANNNRKFSDLIKGYHNKFPELDRQTDQLMNRLKSYDKNNSRILTELSDATGETSSSSISLKSFVGIFDSVKKNRNEFVSSEVVKSQHIQEILKTQNITQNVSSEQGKEVTDVVSQTSEVARDLKPLGSAGDVTLNQLLSSFFEKISPLIEYVKEHPNIINISEVAFRIITPLLVYRSIMGVYNKVLPIPNPTTVSSEVYLRTRRERLFFMIVPAPMLTAFLMDRVLPSLDSQQSKTKQILDKGSEILMSNLNDKKDLSFVSILGFKGSKKFNWKWLIIFLILFLIVITLKIYDIDIINIIFNIIKNPIVRKYLILTFIVFNFIFIFRYIFFIFMIYLISKNKITKSVFLPSFLEKSFDELDSIIKSNNLKFMIDFYYRLMYIYTFLFSISLFYYIIAY